MEKYLVCVFIVLCALPINTMSRNYSRLNNNDDNRIVGGQKVTIQEYPYQALLLLYKGIYVFQCGGSIISTQYILTAAHCIPGSTIIKVRVGSTYSDSGGTLYTSFISRTHPMYNALTQDYDVGYVRIVPRMILDGTNARVVKLPVTSGPPLPGTIITVSGWGATKESGSTARTLMAVKVPVISSEACQKVYSKLSARSFCAGYPEGNKDSCQGDSGGPAVSEDGVLRGIVSYGLGCARPGYPGVYTDVSSVQKWIWYNTGAKFAGENKTA